MNKQDIERAAARAVQATLPGFSPERDDDGRSARRRALTDYDRAQRACAPMGTLTSIVVSHDARQEKRVWYVVEPDLQMAAHYEAHGLTLEPGCKVLVDAEVLRPVAVLDVDPHLVDDADVSTPCGFNPYWDLPPT
jgi:hypothetical protein